MVTDSTGGGAGNQNQPGPSPSTARDARIFDALTGVYSIDYFEHQLRSEVAYSLRHRMPLSLVLVAVDHLEDLTDSFGKDARDHILVSIAEEVLEHTRTEDVLARYGVGMLALLVRGATLEAGAFMAKRIRQSVESAHLSHNGMELPITVSLGVATLDLPPPQTGEELDEPIEHASLVESAERALGRARAASNCVVVAGEAALDPLPEIGGDR
jgi:diguanylate cyclase (GGDEF)-like protein